MLLKLGLVTSSLDKGCTNRPAHGSIQELATIKDRRQGELLGWTLFMNMRPCPGSVADSLKFEQ